MDGEDGDTGLFYVSTSAGGTYQADETTLHLSGTTFSIKALGVTDSQVATANKDGTAGTPSMRTLGAGSTQACAGDDSRLSDSRTPKAHATTHQNGGSDEVATVSPGVGAIPKAGSNARLAYGWLPEFPVCLNRLSTVKVMDAGTSSYVPGGLEIDSLASLEILSTSYLEIG
jgi:hypothetical protein